MFTKLGQQAEEPITAQAGNLVDWVAVRREYERQPDLTVGAIAERHGTYRDKIFHVASKEGWRRRKFTKPKGRAEMVERMMRVLSRQVAHLEEERANSSDEDIAALGRIVVTFEKLVALEGKHAAAPKAGSSGRELEELREKLATRIDQLRSG